MFRLSFKGLTGTLLVVALPQALFAANSSTTASDNSTPSVALLILSGRQSDRPAGTYSRGVTEIIQMLDAKIDAGVISAFIQNSPIPYNPDAAELIALKEHGASSDLLVAMLHHGDELRLRLAQAQSLIISTPAPPIEELQPQPEVPEPPIDYVPSEGAPVYSGGVCYTFAYRWPWLCQTPVCNSYRPYRYERGCWYAPPGEVHPVSVSEAGHRELGGGGGGGASVASARHAASVSGTAHTSSFVSHSGIGHSGAGRSGGRSR